MTEKSRKKSEALTLASTGKRKVKSQGKPDGSGNKLAIPDTD